MASLCCDDVHHAGAALAARTRMQVGIKLGMPALLLTSAAAMSQTVHGWMHQATIRADHPNPLYQLWHLTLRL